MKTLDDIIYDKLSNLINYMLSKVIKPDITIENVNELTLSEIKNIKQKYGIEGIILDVDDTLRKELKNIPECNKKWLDAIKGEFKITILSNGIDGRIKKYFQEKGIDYIGFAHKPLKKNFLKACEKMNVSAEKVLVIGDSLFDDIHGGKRNNMKTVLVRNVEDEER